MTQFRIQGPPVFDEHGMSVAGRALDSCVEKMPVWPSVWGIGEGGRWRLGFGGVSGMLPAPGGDRIIEPPEVICGATRQVTDHVFTAQKLYILFPPTIKGETDGDP
jgi:hypothetical protein